MFFRPCFNRREMDSRKAPVSKEVRRPETSRREIGPAWLMVAEKFVSCTVRTPSAGEVILPVSGKQCAENFYAKEDRCGPGSVHRCGRDLSPEPMIGNRKDAARETELFRPKMQQRLFTVAAHFPGHPRKRRNAPAVLANLNNPRGGQLLEAGLHFSREFLGKIVNEIRSWGNMSSLPASRSVTLAPLAAHDEPLDQWLRKVRAAHAFLDDGNIVQHAPKLDNLVLQVSNRESSARIAVAGLSDRTRIQQISARKLGAQGGERFARARANLQDLQLRVLIGKATLVMGVPEKRDAGSGVQ